MSIDPIIDLMGIELEVLELAGRYILVDTPSNVLNHLWVNNNHLNILGNLLIDRRQNWLNPLGNRLALRLVLDRFDLVRKFCKNSLQFLNCSSPMHKLCITFVLFHCTCRWDI